jgi:hypothetical protein
MPPLLVVYETPGHRNKKPPRLFSKPGEVAAGAPLPDISGFFATE